MIELIRSKEPRELARFRSGPNRHTWDDPGFRQVKSAVREALLLCQEGHCAYCERRINDQECHIDHVRPKASFPEATFDFANMVVSCNRPHHCGHKKHSQTIPLVPGPDVNRAFELRSDGRLAPASNPGGASSADAKETLDTLGLNAPALAWDRAKYLGVLHSLLDNDPNPPIAEWPFRWTFGQYLRP